MAGNPVNQISSAVLKFGEIDINPATVEVVPGSIFVGALCGVMGGIFVLVNSNLGMIRKKYIKAGWQKIAEAVFFSLMTTTCFYWLPRMAPQCVSSANV